MPELKYILIDILPQQEKHYLQNNLGAETITTIHVNALPGPFLAQLSGFLAEECIFISENRTHVDMAIDMGMATLVYLGTEELVQSTEKIGPGHDALPQKTDQMSAESHLSPDMYAEGMEEIDLNFLCRVYQRHHNLPWTILETERCIVKEFSMDYLDALFELYAGEGMTDYMEPLHPYEQEREYQQSYMENMYRFYGYGMWLVCEKETGKLIGRAGFDYKKEMGEELQIGYAIGVPYQHRGYATEVCRAIIDYARTELEIHSICCFIEEKNEKSIGLARKLGFVPRGIVEINGKNLRKFRWEIPQK